MTGQEGITVVLQISSLSSTPSLGNSKNDENEDRGEASAETGRMSTSIEELKQDEAGDHPGARTPLGRCPPHDDRHLREDPTNVG